jgi:hypothetical protein
MFDKSVTKRLIVIQIKIPQRWPARILFFKINLNLANSCKKNSMKATATEYCKKVLKAALFY